MKKLIAFLLSVAAFGVQLEAAAQIPQMIAYQGFLSKDTGAVTATLPASFTLWDAQSGGNQVWNQQSQSVQVQDGYYSVMLNFSQNWQNGNANFSKQYWLEVLIDNQTLTPRLQLAASPYAMNARRADTADVAVKLVQDAPLGTVVAYALGNYDYERDIVARGWRICDGSIIDKTETGSPDFFSALAYQYGNAGANKAYLPDFRGVFLRGLNAGRTDGYVDPDSSSRVKQLHSNVTGSAVGTMQMDTLESHRHQYPHKYYGIGPANSMVYPSMSNPGTTEPSGSYLDDPLYGGSETRPKNAAVYWLIKVK
jgi:hypothetical protein